MAPRHRRQLQEGPAQRLGGSRLLLFGRHRNYIIRTERLVFHWTVGSTTTQVHFETRCARAGCRCCGTRYRFHRLRLVRLSRRVVLNRAPFYQGASTISGRVELGRWRRGRDRCFSSWHLPRGEVVLRRQHPPAAKTFSDFVPCMARHEREHEAKTSITPLNFTARSPDKLRFPP